jgi:hypothetical protein
LEVYSAFTKSGGPALYVLKNKSNCVDLVGSVKKSVNPFKQSLFCDFLIYKNDQQDATV